VVGSAISAPYTRAWDSRTVPDGDHLVSARAVDTSGNSATSPATRVVVANQAPNLLANPSLETASGSVPTCWILGGYGTNTATWTRTTDAHSGAAAERLDVTSWTSGDRKLVSAQDAGTCAPPATVGRTYTLSAWYKATAAPTFFAYYRTTAGAWVYWAQSPSLPVATAWTSASWTTPALPSGAAYLSVGIGLKGTGSLTTDDLGLALAP
jgi:hypothetical protein